MTYLNEKNGGAVYAASPLSPSEPMSAGSRTSGFATLADFEKKDLVSQIGSSWFTISFTT